MPQKVTRELLSLSQMAVLGRDGLELLDERVSRRVAGHICGTIVENFNAPLKSEIESPRGDGDRAVGCGIAQHCRYQECGCVLTTRRNKRAAN